MSMENKNLPDLIWAYLDNDISIEERVRIDKMRLADGAFDAQFREAEHIHLDLGRLPLEQASPEFSSSLESAVLSEFGRNPAGVSITPLVVFGVLLIGLGGVYTFLNPAEFVAIDFIPGVNSDQFDVPLIDALSRSIGDLNMDISWHYFLMLLLIPILALSDRWAQKGFSNRSMLLF